MKPRFRSRASIVPLSAVAVILALTGLASAASAGNKTMRSAKSAPTNAQRPKISGTTAVGKSLHGVAGRWRGVKGRRGYKLSWIRCSSSTGRCARVKGTNTHRYVLRLGDAGSVIKLSVRASNAYGSSTAISAPTRIVRKKPRRPRSKAPLPDVGVAFHCTWSDYTDDQRAVVLDKLKAAGVTWVRIDVGWASLQESGRGFISQWYVDRVDGCVNAARARGIKVLAMLWATPAWANDGQARNVPPNNAQDYASIANWAADHFRGRVAAWEIWNEPDPAQSSWSWQGNAAQYVGLLKAAYPAIKTADANAKVVFAGTSSADESFTAAAYQAGAKGSFDVMAVHPYQAISDMAPEKVGDNRNWWFARVDALHQVMVANGDGATPVWFTEFGWSSHPTKPGAANWQRGVSEDQQGDYLVRAVKYASTHYPWVENIFWYAERNQIGVDIQNANYGLLRYDLSEKPAYRALRSLLKP